jgi:hypothetical protein
MQALCHWPITCTFDLYLFGLDRRGSESAVLGHTGERNRSAF